MAEEPQVPAQPEGASQPTKKRSTPVNLAMVEAAERGIDLETAPTPKKPAEPAPAPPPAPKAAKPDPVESALPPEPAQAEPTEAGAPADEPIDESASPVEALNALAETARQKRLSPRDEDKATALLRTCLSTGETSAALAAMPKLPWILGVRGIEQAWPQLSAEGRTELLNNLATLESEHAIRLRLSVARSLAKLDPPVGIQLAGSVCKTMWDAEKGALSPDHSKLIGNVFIGRGKPWILQLSLEGLDPAEADAIVSCVVFSAFNVNNPPITQLSVLRYAGSRLADLHANLLAMVAKGVSRWSGKWQDSLRKEVSDLPEAISASLKSERPAKAERRTESAPRSESAAESSEREDEEEEGEIPLPPALEEKLKHALESGDPEAAAAATLEANAWRDAQASAAAEEEAGEEAPSERERRGDKRGRRGRDRDRDRGERSDRNDRPDRKERPVYVSREQEAATKSAFHLGAALKQIENHVAQLRNELSTTQAKLRKAESGGPRRAPDKVLLSVEEANLSPDELKRLIVQLEQRNTELQSRVEELLADSETRALATAADADVTAQYRTLLKLKLQEDYSDYLALEKNLPEYVVQQHYRALIRHVFGVLRDEGVGLQGDLPPPPPEPLPPPPPPPVIEDEEEEEDSPLDKLDEDAEPDAEQAEADEAEEPLEEVAEEAEEAEPANGDAEAGEESSSDEEEPREKPTA
jgi:hypothetical protein